MTTDSSAPLRLDIADAAEFDWKVPRPLRPATRAFAEALFMSDVGLAPRERIDWLLEELDDYLARSGTRAQLVFQGAITALQTLAPLSDGKPLPLTALSPEARAEAIEKFEETPLGLAVLGAKAMMCLIWYEHPEVREDVGIDAVCLKSAQSAEAGS